MFPVLCCTICILFFFKKKFYLVPFCEPIQPVTSLRTSSKELFIQESDITIPCKYPPPPFPSLRYLFLVLFIYLFIFVPLVIVFHKLKYQVLFCLILFIIFSLVPCLVTLCLELSIVSLVFIPAPPCVQTFPGHWLTLPGSKTGVSV